MSAFSRRLRSELEKPEDLIAQSSNKLPIPRGRGRWFTVDGDPEDIEGGVIETLFLYFFNIYGGDSPE